MFREPIAQNAEVSGPGEGLEGTIGCLDDEVKWKRRFLLIYWDEHQASKCDLYHRYERVLAEDESGFPELVGQVSQEDASAGVKEQPS